MDAPGPQLAVSAPFQLQPPGAPPPRSRQLALPASQPCVRAPGQVPVLEFGSACVSPAAAIAGGALVRRSSCPPADRRRACRLRVHDFS
jgi:hypothetical protein